MPNYRHAATRDLLLGSRYRDRFRAMRPNNLLAYWPLNEKAGTTGANSVLDWSGNARHAAPTNVVFGVNGIMDSTSPQFNGTTALINIYGASLSAAFNPSEGTVFAWAKVANAGVWTDATQRYIIALRADGSNRVEIQRTGTDNQLSYIYQATAAEIVNISMSTVEWFSVALTWSFVGDTINAYLNGVSVGTSGTLGVWAGTLGATTTNIGALSAALRFWSGNLCNVGIWNAALNSGEIKKLSRLN